MKNCSKNILLTILVILFLALASTGAYFLLNKENSEEKTLDKYQEISELCNTNESDTGLSVECKALLLNISSQENNTNCFNVEIISKNDTLEDFEFCESTTTISYENDLLEYKKLKPVNIQIDYSHDQSSGTYTLQDIYFTAIDETYVQEIINKDIDTLINTQIDRELTSSMGTDGKTYLGADQSTYTIKNSVDFCPSPDELPDYVTNTDEYANFYNTNILTSSDYSNLSEADLFLEIFRKLFACDSSADLGYSVCDIAQSVDTTLLPDTLTQISTSNITWGTKVDLMSRVYLKQINGIYNNIYITEDADNSYLEDINTLITNLNSKEGLSETTFCAMYKVYDAISDEYGMNYIQTLVINNLADVSTYQCLDVIDSSQIDTEGTYLKVYFNSINDDSIFKLYNRCNNLSSLLK